MYHPDDLLVFEYDGSIDRGMPEAVVFPANAVEGEPDRGLGPTRLGFLWLAEVPGPGSAAAQFRRPAASKSPLPA